WRRSSRRAARSKVMSRTASTPPAPMSRQSANRERRFRYDAIRAAHRRAATLRASAPVTRRVVARLARDSGLRVAEPGARISAHPAAHTERRPALQSFDDAAARACGLRARGAHRCAGWSRARLEPHARDFFRADTAGDEYRVIRDLGDLRGGMVRTFAAHPDLRGIDDRLPADCHQCLAGHPGGECGVCRARTRSALLPHKNARKDLPAVDSALLFFWRASCIRFWLARQPGRRDDPPRHWPRLLS